MIRLLVPSHHPVLRQVALEVGSALDRPRFNQIVSDLYDTMQDLGEKHRPAAGLAAPQIGESLQIIYINVSGMRSVLVNPVVQNRTERTVIDYEGCLSLPGVNVAVERAYGIVLSYQLAPGGPTYRNRYVDFIARVLQHEVDHLEGRLITDAAVVGVKE